ncbi:MAG: hypothetical protein AAF490_26560 [Chloroflexota bacterium]
MDIKDVNLQKAIVCAYLAKEVYYKFPQEVAANPDIEEKMKFKAFSKFPNANVELHHADESDTQCAIMQEEGSDHIYLIFRGTEKGDDWKTNVQFSRDLFQVRDKGSTSPGETTEDAAMSFNDDDDDASFTLPADDAGSSDDEESDMHFEPVEDEGKAKHFEFVESSSLESADLAPAHPRAQMHLGFVTAYMTVQDYVHNYVVKHQPKKITVTGHSLGGALATLCAVDMKLTYLGKYDVDLYTYGAPCVGNTEFPDLFNTAVPKSYRFVNGLDVVPQVPRPWQGYKHVNHEIKIGKGWTWRFLSRRGTDHFMTSYIQELEAI